MYTRDDSLKASNSAVYDAIRSTDNGLFLRYMPTKYYHFVCYLSARFVHASVCAREQLEIHSPRNTKKMTDVQAHTCTAFYFIFKLLPLLNMIGNMPVVITLSILEW